MPLRSRIFWGKSLAFEQNIHHRRSIRLPGYDYAQAEAYFVTVCTWGKEPLFGDVSHGLMRLDTCGAIVVHEWVQTRRVRANVELDVFVVMPNHFHGIIIVHDAVVDPPGRPK